MKSSWPRWPHMAGFGWPLRVLACRCLDFDRFLKTSTADNRPTWAWLRRMSAPRPGSRQTITRMQQTRANVLASQDLLLTLLRSFSGSVTADFRFALWVFQISKFCGHSPGDCCGLAAGLETREVGSIAPCQRAAQPLARC